ncbi:MAG: hypothetical protein KAS32_01050, partial [Candidatus Peribacteraceae bacterium]|nr:hypothetical protein [Candidatus Peribacteraceae bacterium]
GPISYDYEAWGDKNTLRPELCSDYRILCIAVGLEDNDSPYEKGVCFKFDTRDKLGSKSIEREWKEVIRMGKQKRCVAHYCNYEHKANIRRFGFTEYLRDTSLMNNTLDELSNSSLGAVGASLNIRWSSYKAQMEGIQKDPSSVPIPALLRYGGLDGLLTATIYPRLYKQLEDANQLKVQHMQERFAITLAEVESNGMSIDPDEAVTMRAKIQNKIEELKEAFNEMDDIRKCNKWSEKNIKSFKPGNPFNPKSHVQMKRLCLEILKLPIKPKITYKAGKKVPKYVLDKTALEKYEDTNPVVKQLNLGRSLDAMFSGFLDKWENFTSPKGCVHTRYTQDVAVTGRLTSVNPNLQNIPRDSEVKKVFNSRFEDGWLINADYSQIEPRILAGWSGDEKMCEALNGGYDFHKYVASQIYNVEYDAVTKKMRFVGKRRNLGSMYGQTAHGLAEAVGISVKDAEKICRIYDEQFLGVSKFKNDKKKYARKHLKIYDLFGGVRHLKNADSNNQALRGRALRQAVNFIIQSTANRMCLLAMALLLRYLKERKLEAVIVGPTHDSIVVDCAGKDKKAVMQAMSDAMLIHNKASYWKDMPCPLTIDFKVGRNLYEMKDVKKAA